MQIAFMRCMTQRYRAILPLIDPIIEAGHELTIIVSGKRVDWYKAKRRPCDVSDSDPQILGYLAENFGFEIKHRDKVKFTTDKHIKRDLGLCYDDHNTGEKVLGIPYNTNNCYRNGEPIWVGNPVVEAVQNCDGEEVFGSLLIIHPGGGRGYITPIRKKFDKIKAVDEQVRFFQTIFDKIKMEYYTIKPHPFPYLRCSASSVSKYVVPRLKCDGEIAVVDRMLINQLKVHEYIINFGGTTALWLMDSGKKWCNITGMAKYSDKREKLIPGRGGGCTLDNIQWQSNYKKHNAIDNIMGLINEFAGV